MRYRFVDAVVDVDAYTVVRGGEPRPVEPQVFEVLAYLIKHRDRPVPRAELLDEIWGDRFVSDSALSTRLRDAWERFIERIDSVLASFDDGRR